MPGGEPPLAAQLDEHGWEIHCAAPGCGAKIADCSWLDLQMAMILRLADELTARKAMASLPAPQMRYYRLGVEFPWGWRQRDSDGLWQFMPQRARRPVTSAATRTRELRVIRGHVRSIGASSEGVPPLAVACPVCNAEQVIEPLRRKGLPVVGE
ncbi:MAG: hypothetical protein IT303_19015 [Dehalococcoidia bacterium]|nr:hypothetical protein [Dehalococcoidia bacterium]